MKLQTNTQMNLLTNTQSIGLALIAGLILMAQAPSAHAVSLPPGGKSCQPFKYACTQAGFTVNDSNKDNRLVKACLIPLTKGQTAMSPVTGQIAAPPPGADGPTCATHIHKKS